MAVPREAGHGNLFRKAGEAKQSLKARVGAQRIVARIDFEPGQLVVSARVALFQRVQGFVILAQSNERSRAISWTRRGAGRQLLCQLGEDGFRFGAAPCGGAGVAEIVEIRGGPPAGNLNGLLEFVDSY